MKAFTEIAWWVFFIPSALGFVLVIIGILVEWAQEKKNDRENV